MAIPRLGRRISIGSLLAAGVLFTLVGMFWLSRIAVGASFWVSVALPMVLIGVGQGLAFAPMTSAGVSGVTPGDAGAASGLVNTAHQLGSSLGLGVLVTIAVSVGGPDTDTPQAVADHMHAALTGSSIFLAVALVITVVFLTVGHPLSRRPGRQAQTTRTSTTVDEPLEPTVSAMVRPGRGVVGGS